METAFRKLYGVTDGFVEHKQDSGRQPKPDLGGPRGALAGRRGLQSGCVRADGGFGLSDPDGGRLERRDVRRHHGLRRPVLFGGDRLRLLHHPLHLW